MTRKQNHHSQNQNHLPHPEPPHQHRGPTILKRHLCGHTDRRNVRGSIDPVKTNTLLK